MMQAHLFILVDKVPVAVDNVIEWATQMDDSMRIVKKDCFEDVEVSTVFLGIDYNFYGDGGKPLVFETMIFGGEHNDYQKRYSTWDEAVAGHKSACILVISKRN